MAVIDIPGAQSTFLLRGNLRIQLVLSIADKALVQQISIILIESCFKVFPGARVLLDDGASNYLLQWTRSDLRGVDADLNFIIRRSGEGAIDRKQAGNYQKEPNQDQNHAQHG